MEGQRVGSLVSRTAHLGGLIQKTIRRDRRVRRLHLADERLEGGARTAPITFDARRPAHRRTLPAREVPHRSLAEHRDETLHRVRDALSTAGILIATRRDEITGATVIGVRSTDWDNAMNSIAAQLPGLLIGFAAPGVGPSLRQYTRVGNAQSRPRRATACIVDPAVTVHEGRVIARHGFETGLLLERWDHDEESGWYITRAWNPTTRVLRDVDFTLNGVAPADSALALPPLTEITAPIDVVYTWVDGTDPHWLERKRRAIEAWSGGEMTEDAAADLRFVDHDELRYSLRSLERYAPWVRHVYIVTDGQRPAWLRTDHPRLSVVDHRDIFPDHSVLPTYNSHAIEACLHRIDGLSEHFLYFNDDVFLSSPVGPGVFFHANGLASMYLSRAQVAPGEPEPGEPASDSAGKNARRMVLESHGVRVGRKLFHTAFALQRSVSQEIEQRWPEEISRTRASRLRRISDVTLSGALHQAYALASSRAVVRGIRYRYVNVGAASAQWRLESLMRDRDDLQTFCLNESDPDLPFDTIDRMVRGFLARRFPDASSFELPGA